MTFLSEESQHILDDIFHLRYSVRWKEEFDRFKQAGKKFIIPIGYQRLKIHNIGYKKASNGADMLVVEFWKQPEHINVIKEKPSYKTIDSYHIVQNNGNKKLSESWFKPFTSCYTKAQLDQLLKLKGKWFMAMVQHTEDIYNDNEFFKSEIIAVYKDGHIIDSESIDYMKLFKPLKEHKEKVEKKKLHNMWSK